MFRTDLKISSDIEVSCKYCVFKTRFAWLAESSLAGEFYVEGGVESKNVAGVEEQSFGHIEELSSACFLHSKKRDFKKKKAVCLVNQHFLTCDRRR